MKDIPHHIKKYSRQVIRSEHRLEQEDESYANTLPDLPQPTKRPRSQLRKQAKQAMRKKTNARTPTSLSPEERNHKMKTRVPVFDRWNIEVPKQGARPTKKKTPRI